MGKFGAYGGGGGDLVGGKQSRHVFDCIIFFLSGGYSITVWYCFL